jgi:hypothetical protein
MKSTLKLTLLLGTAVAAMNITALAGPSGPWPTGYPTRVKTKETALKCCLPGEKVALACKDCKTVNAKNGEDKKGVLAWFKPDSMHDCSGCKGKITVKYAASGKGAPYGTYSHVCSKCGPDSAYTCATHKS